MNRAWDSVPDAIDNCPPIGYDNLATRNPNQANSDLGLLAEDGMPAGDELGDACDADDDADGVPDFTDGQIDYLSSKVRHDNCRTVRNPDQRDENPRNGIGDACQFDTDRDGLSDGLEVTTGSDPLDPASFNLAQALSFIELRPSAFTLVLNTLIGEASRQLTVSGQLIDGNRIDLTSRSAAIVERQTGLADAVIALHKSPGPHLADIRANWFPMVVWRWLADATVYVLLFISVSGIYMWTALRAERKAGLALLTAGALSFLGVVSALAK